MKSFVTTAVAALIAANGALANSTDASTSGTVPELPDQCEFLNVKDGTMIYFPGEHNYTIGHDGTNGIGNIIYNRFMMGGRWIANEAAEIQIKHRGASQLMVEATNKLVNSSTGRVYDVQVDYQNPGTVNVLAPADYWQYPHVNEDYPHIPSYGGDSVKITMGEQQKQAGMEWGPFGWMTTVYNPVTPVMENQAGVEWTPETTRTGQYMEAKDRAIFNLVEDVELSLSNQVSHHRIAISGVAWMVDSMGVSKYDPDNHDLEDGNYYIEHKVTCLQ